MQLLKKPSVGLALSGSGNRTSFYIGFIETLSKSNVPIDYIAAMSGGSLVAAAFGAGVLEDFKAWSTTINKKTVKKYIKPSLDHSGIYSLAPLEEFMRSLTKGLTFEEAKPKMAFVAVDIETGEQVNLCMGEMAKAACVSCALPGIFEPLKWGGRTLVDGGLINSTPLNVLKEAGIDITIAVNMGGTKNIFTKTQMNTKKVLDFFKSVFLIDQAVEWFGTFDNTDREHDFTKKPGIFSVLGKSMDIAIKASSVTQNSIEADLVITPKLKTKNRMEFSERESLKFYEIGCQMAKDSIPKIQKLIIEKELITQPV